MTKPPDWVEFARRAAYFPAADALVFADVHVGRDAASDVALPLGEHEDLLDRLRAHLDDFEPGRVVLAGDLLHVHGSVPDGVRDTVDDLRAAIEASGATLDVLEGNHDTMLDAVGVDAVDHAELSDGTVVAHGHEPPPRDASRYVVGHQHPAVEIEGQRHPCFLYGPGQYAGGDVLVLPAFTRLAAGTPVESLSDGTAVSPLLADPSGYRPVVVSEGEALGFPALGDLRGLL
ncbi:metallophosphoesterase family protein [Halobacterium jilantaiense]|uniref:Putative phosphoesterase n=1 Tax=Halobacterium jilantaiense TaxID=355548 RepID=A0A1I0NM32_9EURY|nr:metallophosphoesterase [Halobacterium jilantaiense]SEW02507.1 putative phosphoesterase [Halobacterium jilantaiense]